MLFNLRGEGSDVLELDIFEDIGRGGFFFEALSAQQVRARLKANPDAKTIRVTINSNGGEVTEGLSIYEDLVAHKARVEVRIQGLAASIASVIAMAGDDIAIASTGFLMVHGVTGGASGDANDLEDVASIMRKAQAVIASVYAKRSKQPVPTVEKWLMRDTYMNAQEALANGLVDRIDDAIVATANHTKTFAMFNSATLEGAPDALLEAIRGAQAMPKEPITAPAPPTPVPTPTGDPSPPSQPAPLENTTMTEKKNEPDATPTVARTLGLPMGAAETDIVAACGRLRELELQILAITGATLSNEAIGAIRALKVTADKAEKLEAENVELRAKRDEQEFDALVATGTSQPIKLSPASAQEWRGWFDAAKARGTGQEVVGQLRGFLKSASPIIPERRSPPSNNGSSGAGAALGWNGKTYAQLTFRQRAQLKTENAELHSLMKRDWEDQGSPTAAA